MKRTTPVTQRSLRRTMKSRLGLTLVEVTVSIGLLSALGAAIAATTGSATTVADLSIHQASVETQLARFLAVLRPELRSAGIRESVGSPAAPLQASPGRVGDVLQYQVPIQTGGSYYDFTNRQMNWGAGQTANGWVELRFIPERLLDEARFGLNGADLNGNGSRNDTGLRLGRVVRRVLAADRVTQVGADVILASNVLDRGSPLFAVDGQGAARLIDPTAAVTTTAGTIVIDVTFLGLAKPAGATASVAVLSRARTSIRPRNLE